ncbi:MAG: hypothetical protein IJ809_03015 [Clostridia bacterium]|nr:hypothetical protein [Clostridia bacterium]
MGMLAGFGVAIWIVSLVICVLTIIAMWKIFTKAGEAGWKAIVPVYNAYILFKISWNTKMFWIFLAISFVAGLLSGVPVLAFILGIADIVISIMLQVKFAKAFGHGGGFAVGLIFLNTIFTLILGFGSSKYVGNGETADVAKAE